MNVCKQKLLTCLTAENGLCQFWQQCFFSQPLWRWGCSYSLQPMNETQRPKIATTFVNLFIPPFSAQPHLNHLHILLSTANDNFLFQELVETLHMTGTNPKSAQWCKVHLVCYCNYRFGLWVTNDHPPQSLPKNKVSGHSTGTLWSTADSKNLISALKFS